MNSYTRYFELALTDTPFSRCTAAKTSLLCADRATDMEVKRRHLEYSLRQLDNARERITLELNDLE